MPPVTMNYIGEHTRLMRHVLVSTLASYVQGHSDGDQAKDEAGPQGVPPGREARPLLEYVTHGMYVCQSEGGEQPDPRRGLERRPRREERQPRGQPALPPQTWARP